MPEPFRDELAAAVARVDELEAENADLRVRAASDDAEDVRNAVATLRRENADLQEALERAKKEAAGAREGQPTPSIDLREQLFSPTFLVGVVLGFIAAVAFLRC
jgi:hypothetical protein